MPEINDQEFRDRIIRAYSRSSTLVALNNKMYFIRRNSASPTGYRVISVEEYEPTIALLRQLRWGKKMQAVITFVRRITGAM